MAEYQYVNHEFRPVYDETSKILILGSLPSVKSREQGFYYGHPRNRFWKVVGSSSWCYGTVDNRGEKADAACRTYCCL